MSLSTTWNTAAALGRRNILATAGMIMVAVFIVLAFFARWLAPHDPSHIDLPSRLQPPSSAHWFGTDELGRDIFSRVIYGARISMLVGSSVVAGSLLLGLILGSIAGYYGGPADRVFCGVPVKAILSFSCILLSVRLCALLGAGDFQPDPGPLPRRLGGIRAAGARADAGRQGERVCGSGACPGRERLADRDAPHPSQHYSAGDCASGHRHGRGCAGGGNHELPGAGRSAPHGKLGIHAQRRSCAPV